MANELIKEKIVLDQRAYEEITQILLEGDIIVPDTKPDMAIILQSDAQVAIERTEILTDKVNFVGKLYIEVLYLARGDEKRVHNISLVAPIDEFINIEGITSDMLCVVKPDIINLDFRMINDRKIGYKAISQISLYAQRAQTFEVVVDIEDLPQNQQLKTHLSLNKSVAHKTDKFVITDQIAVPPGKSNIREMLQLGIQVANQDVRVQNGRVNVFGDLLITTLYRGFDEDSILEFMEHELPFNGHIEMVDCKEDMFADCTFSLSDHQVEIMADEDGEERIIEIDATLNIHCKVSAMTNIEVLEDAHIVNRHLEISRTPIRYHKLIGRNKNQSTIKEVVSLDEGSPDILQVFKVKGKVTTDEVTIISDKVIVEGVIDADILYIAESDDMPLYSHKAIIPFRQIVDMKGAMPEMLVSLSANVEHVGFNMLSGREVETRFLVSLNASVSGAMEASLISDIVVGDMERAELDKMPSITLYVVQKGDTLWKIAKEYNTSIGELSAINDIEEPDRIMPGQKLLIIKKSA